jgi:hypothetical protein
MKIWQVQCDVMAFAPIYLSDRVAYRELPSFDGKPVRDLWRLFEAYFHEGMQVGDFYYLSPGAMAANARAIDPMPEKLVSEVEVLPLTVASGPVVIINVLNVIDCLNEPESELKRYASSGRVMKVLRYSLETAGLADEYLFKIPQFPRTKIFATQRFLTYVSDHDLTGLEFDLVFDDDAVAKNESYRIFSKQP